MSEKYAFAEPEILRMDADVLADYMKHSELKLYQHMIDDMLSQKEHTLSEKEELLLAKASQVMSVPDEVFSKYNNADVKFGYITDEEGKSGAYEWHIYKVYAEPEQGSKKSCV